MNPAAYTRTAAALHWGHALLVGALLVIGLDMVDLPKGPERTAAFALHKSLGLVALALIGLRLGWRLRHPPPPHPGIGATEKALAAAMHRMLYILLVLVPFSGFLSICFTPYPLKFFGLALPKPGWPDPDLNALFGTLHKGFLLTLGVAILLHVGAALRHAWRLDGTLARMLPMTGNPRQL